jgi:polyisoprenoid-binding protein YceI
MVPRKMTRSPGVRVLALGAALAAVGLATACAPKTAAPKSSAPNSSEAAATTPAPIAAPAGRYEIDPAHSSLIFHWRHLGLADYTARFTKISSAIVFDPADPAASSVTADIDPMSIRADFPGDYRKEMAAFGGTPFKTWDEYLARSPQTLNADQFKQISFRSTRIVRTGPRTATITGDLTLHGQTHPVTLAATLTGSISAYPMVGGAAIGMSATGSFKRSDFGMTQYLSPPMIGDVITLEFNGEFKQVRPKADRTGKPAG